MKVIKRNGSVISFGISNIIAALTEVAVSIEAIRKRSQMILDMAMSDGECDTEYHDLENKKRMLKSYRRYLIQSMNQLLRWLWLKRNSDINRSNTASVSDKMLSTIPTPPTAETAIRSLWQRGMADGVAA